jgi:hypothetical protein
MTKSRSKKTITYGEWASYDVKERFIQRQNEIKIPRKIGG